MLQEPAWLKEQRQSDWQKFSALPWPAASDDAWRRSPLEGLDWDRISLQPPSINGHSASVPSVGWAESGLIVHQGAGIVSQTLLQNLRQSGVIFGDLQELTQTEANLVRRHLISGFQETAPMAKLNALNQARWTHGVFVYVPKNVRVELPLRIVHSAGKNGDFLAPRTLIVLEAGSELTLIEETFGESDAGPQFIPSVVEITLGENASLRYYHLQNWGRHVRHFFTQRARLGRDASLVALLAALGSRFTKAAVETLVAGPGARSNLYGVTFGDDSQQFEYHTLQDHSVPRTTSDLLYKTALRDRSSSLYTGLIRITKEAAKTDAYQANRNLLLSGEAKADSIPMLEILTDDVRCTHGATVGPVDPEQLFYLTSRGIGEETAERMIVEGFFEQVLQQLPTPGLRDHLHAHIERKLGA
ncbi:MAG: Fe-S cluster assembly protein SufD [Candidatus Omnitrophica bacterium]|nr:Fe-S cluster assembly protein SufD [Candidatus Omnitrophota bacterium]